MAETVQYDRTSPYYKTAMNQNYLDVASLPSVPKKADDVLFTVNKTYQYRPDLLAYDLYGDPGLWWVFAMRNPNAIQDPVFSMKIGTQIFLPKKETLQGIIS